MPLIEDHYEALGFQKLARHRSNLLGRKWYDEEVPVAPLGRVDFQAI